MTAASKLSAVVSAGVDGAHVRGLLAGNHAAAEAARMVAQREAAEAARVLDTWEVSVSEIGSMEFRNPAAWDQAASIWPEFRADGSLFVTGNTSRTAPHPLSVFLAAAILRASRNAAARNAAEREAGTGEPDPYSSEITIWTMPEPSLGEG